MNYLKQELYTLIKHDDEIFNFLQESALDGLWYWDLESPENEWMNARFWETLGYDPAEMPHKAAAWQNIIHQEDLMVAFENFEKHCADPKHPYDQIVRYEHKNGGSVWIRCRGMAVRDEDGKPVRMLGAHTDISVQKESEAQLRKRIEYYDHVIEGADIGTWYWNVQADSIEINDIWAASIGRSLDELQGLDFEQWMSFVHPDDQAQLRTQMQQHLEKKQEHFKIKVRMRHLEGHWIWVESKGRVVNRSAEGLPLLMTGSQIDITNRKLAEELLRNDSERKRLFIDQAPSSLAMFDRELRVLAASRQWLQDYCPELASATGKAFTEVLDDPESKWQNIFERCLAGASIKRDEDRTEQANGELRWTAWEVRPWFNHLGKIGGLLMYSADITKKKAAENEVKALLDITTDQNHRLLNFAHIVSHNLRSHSGNLSMLLELMESELPEATNNDYFPILQTAVDALQDTILHLTEVVQINTRTIGSLEPLELSATIDSTLENIKGLALETKVKINSFVNRDLHVSAIPAYLDSIVLNLITNAIKYRSPEREAQITLRTEVQAPYVVLHVEDNGLGIDLERNGAKLFGMYKTFHNNPDARGIGLFITKNQVEAMGGKIETDSQVDVGTTFSVYLKHEKNRLHISD